VLKVTYSGADRRIRFVDVDYDIPPEVINKAATRVHKVKFAAKEGSSVGRVFMYGY
jgi:hypothetical protein